MEYKELQQKVVEWGKERGVLDGSTIGKQLMKSVSEFGEFVDAINKGNLEEAKMELGDFLVTIILACEIADVENKFTPTVPQPVDLVKEVCKLFYSFQDTFTGIAERPSTNSTLTSVVTLLLHVEKIAKMLDSDMTQCLDLAYTKISKRKTQMVNGVAVKETDNGDSSRDA